MWVERRMHWNLHIISSNQAHFPPNTVQHCCTWCNKTGLFIIYSTFSISFNFQLRKEGIRHLYRGLLPPLIQRTTTRSIMYALLILIIKNIKILRFGTNEKYQQFFHCSKKGPSFCHCLCSFLGFIHTFIKFGNNK